MWRNQIGKRYATRSLVRRWHKFYFENIYILDIAALNICTIFAVTNPTWCDNYLRSGRRQMHFNYLRTLPWLREERLQDTSRIHNGLKIFMKKFFGIIGVPRNISSPERIAGRCEMCRTREKSARDENKASKICEQYKKLMCVSDSSQYVCLSRLHSIILLFFVFPHIVNVQLVSLFHR